MAQVLKDEIKNAIFASAKREFMLHGYERSSIRQIASGAGITSGNIYRYFDSKESIYRELVQEVVVEIDRILYQNSNGVVSFMRLPDTNSIRQNAKNQKQVTQSIISALGRVMPDLMENHKEETLILLKTADRLDLIENFNLVQWIGDIFKVIFHLEESSYHVAYGLCKSLESIVEMDLSGDETRKIAEECIHFYTNKR